ncbi:hypothetical protein P23_1662 [Acinetobacter calcoaceticus]|nr:hypothetical protein P23_1662 [Acinetobacter calcoaceticus]
MFLYKLFSYQPYSSIHANFYFIYKTKTYIIFSIY